MLCCWSSRDRSTSHCVVIFNVIRFVSLRLSDFPIRRVVVTSFLVILWCFRSLCSSCRTFTFRFRIWFGFLDSWPWRIRVIWLFRFVCCSAAFVFSASRFALSVRLLSSSYRLFLAAVDSTGLVSFHWNRWWYRWVLFWRCLCFLLVIFVTQRWSALIFRASSALFSLRFSSLAKRRFFLSFSFVAPFLCTVSCPNPCMPFLLSFSAASADLSAVM